MVDIRKLVKLQTAPFNPRIRFDRLEELLKNREIAKENLSDPLVVSYLSCSVNWEDLKVPRDGADLSFAQKVAESIYLLGQVYHHDFGFELSEHVTSDFDNLVQFRDVLIEYLSPNCGERKIRSEHRENQPFFAIYDLSTKTTKLFCDRFRGKKGDFRNVFANNKPADLVTPFAGLPVFPFYSVSEIVILNNPREGTSYSPEGERKTVIPEGFFSM